MNKFVKAIYKVQHEISSERPSYCSPALYVLLFKVSHGSRCLYTIDLFKKKLTYINSIIPFYSS